MPPTQPPPNGGASASEQATAPLVQPGASTAAQAQTTGDPAYAEEVQAGFQQLREMFRAMDAGQQPDWEAVRGRPGVVLEPMPWDRLCQLITVGGERALGTLGRHPLGIKAYWNHRDRVLLKQYASVSDYLLLDIFGFGWQPAPDGRKQAVVPPGFFRRPPGDSHNVGSSNSHNNGSSGTRGCQGGSDGGRTGGGGGDGGTGRNDFTLVTKWRPNDFPYHLEPGVTHLNLWANRPLSRGEVEQHIAEKVPPGMEVTWFVNPPAVQSVPSIWHAHVLYRRPPSAAAASGKA